MGVPLLFASGCGDSRSASRNLAKNPPPHVHREASLQEGIKHGPKSKNPVVANKGFDPSKQVAVASDVLKPNASSTEAADSDMPQAGVNLDFDRATRRIAGEIAEALKLRKTLVVWLIDDGIASSDTRDFLTKHRDKEESRFSWIARSASERGKPTSTLSMAVVGYGSKINFLDEEPIDPRRAESLVAALPPEDAVSPRTFAAVNQAADKFLPYRGKGHEILIVIVANNSGRDWDQLDAAIPKLRQKAVPVFGIGNAVPFYRQWHAEHLGGGPPATLVLDSCELESIDLALPQGQTEADLNDSGYGPFGLERLCRATHGEFLRFRSGSISGGWTVAGDGQVGQDMLRRYAPDYVSPQQYQSLLSGNRAYQALHNAARLPRAEQASAFLPMSFRRSKDEAQLAKMLGNAQMKAAEKSPEIDRIYDALAAGQADRLKITSPRWQAEFDLAMGRILAAKARIDGYNAELAVIKQGKAFSDPQDDTWVLHPSDSISAGSALDKMAKSAQMYLNRVIREHPGTPWAEMAQRELMMHTGWEWTETH
jgi:hypothetical protein